jgi:two-component system, cell cycle response regulator
MNKYIQNLVKNVRKQLEAWLDKQNQIQNIELYRFLHSIAGTAATIGLNEASEMAHSLMKQMNESADFVWTKEELQEFLVPLISIFYYQESFSDEERMDLKQEHEAKKLILFVDDDTELLMEVKEELERKGLIVFAVSDQSRAIQFYYDLKPDCVVLDGKNGLDVLIDLKKNMKQQFIPTVMISTENTKDIRIKSYQSGADDFIPKPFEIDELLVRIERQLERKQAIDELILIDELTKVNNRKHLNPAYDRLVANLKRRKEPFSVALLDLDNFKQVNETYGHATGDRVLVRFAQLLRNGLRPNDIVVRYGGEEFIVLLPETKQKEAKMALERILSEFSQVAFRDLKGNQDFSCTFSAGIHEIQEDEVDFKTNFNLVDSALYEAKNNGKNMVKLAPLHQAFPPKRLIHVGIIDDDPIIRTMLEDLISKSIFADELLIDIKSFKDGVEFFESDWYLKENEPYFIILDGMMPRMDGLEVLQKLRNLKYQERFTVMMLTSRKSELDISRALRLGADDYITKPFKLLELETRVSHLLKRMK